MKKIFYVGAISALLLSACGDKEDTGGENTNSSEVSNEESSGSKYPFPSETTHKGDATITVSTPSGESGNGFVPVLFVSEDDSLVQIDIDYEGFDGSMETFVYINEIYYGTEQAGERTQSTLNLSEDNLKPGNYTVTAVQFTDNDPTKSPIILKETHYKIEKAS